MVSKFYLKKMKTKFGLDESGYFINYKLLDENIEINLFPPNHKKLWKYTSYKRNQIVVKLCF